MAKKRIQQEVFNFLSDFGENIKTKLTNVCGKTGQYNVPSELFQKRTHRKNRVLISWEVVKNNKLTIEQLATFSGGVAVEFINNDYFDDDNKKNPIFEELKNKLGSDEVVSSIISIRSNDGSSSSSIQREVFEKLTSNTEIKYKGSNIIINKDNYKDYAIKKTAIGGIGNDKWDGFLYISIRGGQQDTIETHHGLELTVFNPACEFANEDVCIDLNLTVGYFTMLSIDQNNLNSSQTTKYKDIFNKLENILKSIEYDSIDYSGNLLDYVKNHPSVKMIKGELTDPIQLKRILIENFSNESRTSDSIDFTHNEAVVYEKYFWDNKKGAILSPTRPTNIFWSFHLSNMMQQDFSLEEYFAYEQERYQKRQNLLKKI